MNNSIKALLKQYGLPILIMEGILLYCVTVLHFAALYWDPLWTDELRYDAAAFSQAAEPENVTPTQSGFLLPEEVGSVCSLSVPLELNGTDRVVINFEAEGTAGQTLHLDLFNPDANYDSPDQEYVITLNGGTEQKSYTITPGTSHPETAFVRFYETGDEAATQLTLRNIQITAGIADRNVFSFRHVPSLLLAFVLLILFSFTLSQYWQVRPQKEAVVLTADKRIIHGALRVTMRLNLSVKGDELAGTVILKNNGYALRSISVGAYPVNVGVSVLDEKDNIIRQDYKRIPIMTEGLFRPKQTLELPVHISGMGDLRQSGGSKLQFALVQEGIAWSKEVRQIYPLA